MIFFLIQKLCVQRVIITTRCFSLGRCCLTSMGFFSGGNVYTTEACTTKVTSSVCLIRDDLLNVIDDNDLRRLILKWYKMMIEEKIYFYRTTEPLLL